MADNKKQRDTYETMLSLLQQWGIDVDSENKHGKSLGQRIWDWVVNGLTVPEMRLKLRNTPEFNRRFPAIRERAKRGLPPLGVGEYIALERAYRNIFMTHGLPPGFYDEQDDFNNFLVNDVSPDELATRVADGFVRVALAPKQVRRAFNRFFGIKGDAALASYFLDPDRAMPVLLRQAQIAGVAGAGLQNNIKLGLKKAADLASRGFDYESSQDEFENLSRQAALFEEGVSETEDLKIEEEGIDYAFGLNNKSFEKVQRRLDQRIAQGAGSTSGAQVSRNGGGIGSSDR